MPVEPFSIKMAFTAITTFISVHSGRENRKKLSETLEIATNALNLHIYTIRQNRLASMNLSKRHIQDAFLASSEISRNISMQGASSILAELIDLPVDEKLPGEEVEYDNRPLISWGYWGRFCIFGLMKDNRNALRQIYECACKYPEICSNIFEPSFFPQQEDYSIRELCRFSTSLSLEKSLPSSCIYSTLPSNLAKSLIDIRISEFKESCKEIIRHIEDN